MEIQRIEAFKIIITNRSAVEKKYRKSAEKVLALIDKIIAADNARGIGTSVVFLDDKTQMREVNGKAVTDITNEKQNVTAVQKIFDKYKPEYMLLFGDTDIIPMIRIKNPVYNQFDRSETDSSKDSEDGEYILSDLPYACKVPYTTQYRKYIEPDASNDIRVVGRIPDIAGNSTSSYITKVVDQSIGWEATNGPSGRAFVLSTIDWSQITRLTARKVFSRKYDFFTSPSETRNENFGLAKYDLHFINCHGGPGEFDFFDSDGYPAITTASLNQQVKKGSIIAAECCFGAELPPGIRRKLPMVYNYMEEGANGFMGSTSTSYGAINGAGNGYDADLITQFFMKYILQGRSAGSALQQARIDFKRDAISTNNGQEVLMSYKTFLQFYLVGDPSIHYRKSQNTNSESVPKGVSVRRELAKAKAESIAVARIRTKKVNKASARPAPRVQNLLEKYDMMGSTLKTYEVTVTGLTKLKSARLVSKKTSIKFEQHVAFKVEGTDGRRKVKRYKALFINEKGTQLSIKFIVSK